ncbi:Undecaprenyl-phosphate mannosyltransferase [Aeoliella mucimassa]|uniref:Undecaprenyl-phosphate mannosyltransferase n=2 Tax=Aeoliella mucimassa TaxID=2527972 RepID=A0A518AMY3_9BACT|nr:Undecaprenyl-phosphate mannosyltransferase [Aeoliella mucimassa]
MLPAYNEAEALPALLNEIEFAFDEAQIPYEVIVVDDGSSDDTALLASQASFHMPVQCITHVQNQGLAGALRTGVAAALAATKPGDVIVTMDADNTQPPGSVERMIQMIREGHDVVIASRYQHGSQIVGVPGYRNFLSFGARALFTVMFPIRGVRDYTCGFRAYRHEILRRADEYYGDQLVSEKGFSCMVDMLLKLHRFKPVVGEVPFILRYDQKGGASKMRVLKTVFQTIHVLIRRRLNLR